MPPASTATPAATTPVMVEVGSPEFADAVTRAVAAAMAAAPPAPAPAPAATIGVPQPVVIQQTSIDLTEPGKDDLTVRFNRFCTFQNCGYQRGQQAGFPRAAAEALHIAGAAFIVHDPRSVRRAA